MLPEIVHVPGTPVGTVSKELAEISGLPQTCRVCLGNLDTNSCAIGSGAGETGTQLMIIGTAGVSIFVTDSGKLDPNKRITVRSNPGFGNWQNYIMTNTGASAFRWFRDSLCSMEAATSQLMGVDPYDIITRIASHSKPGANGVTALTCIQGSHTRIKNEKARGGFFGISLGSTKADIAESILEGICFEMRDIMSMNQELSGKVKRVILCGGAAKSPMWCQMFADVLNKPVEITEVPEIGALGAAMCAGIGAGIFTDCRDAVNKCVKVARTYTPDNDRTAEYQKAFDVWERCYSVSNREIYV